jgi:hypothetical protein
MPKVACRLNIYSKAAMDNQLTTASPRELPAGQGKETAMRKRGVRVRRLERL